MRVGTWLRPMIRRDGILAHYLPGKQPGSVAWPDDYTRCDMQVRDLPPAGMIQDWRCPWTADDTCQECVQGLRDDEEATP